PACGRTPPSPPSADPPRRARLATVGPMFPAPREIRWGDGPGTTAIREVVVDPSLPVQGYRLEVAADGAVIRHADAAGLRYATQTLDAIEEEGRGRAVQVVDHPDHAVRGFMLD